jgi:hypothetical protein
MKFQEIKSALVFRHLLPVLVFIAALAAIPSFAATVTVVSKTFAGTYPYGGSIAYIRIYANTTFVSSSPVTTIQQGTTSNFYQLVRCSVAGPNLICPQFTINSTTDSNVPDARYTADLYDWQNRFKQHWIEGFSVPNSPSTTTWDALELLASGSAALNPTFYYNTTQTDSKLAAKQDLLTCGTTIKTINSTCILGSGNVAISGTAAWGGITGTLSAQSDLNSALAAKQPNLVSGTNIKTINGNSVLGSGDLVIAGGGGGGSGSSLAGNYGNDLASAISSIGSTPTTLMIDADTTCSTALTVPATLILEFKNQAKINKSGSCTINFQGVGIKNPLERVVAFAGFSASNITFSGSTYPLNISADLWDGSTIDVKYPKVDSAFTNKPVHIELYPGTIAAQTTISTKHRVHLNGGTYVNTIASYNSVTSALLMQDDTELWGDGSASIIQESSNNNVQMIRASGVAAYPWDGPNSNIRIHDLYFTGNNGTAYDSSRSVINLGNVHNAWVERCTFDHTHGFAVYVGAFSSANNVAQGVWIKDNITIGLATQQMGTVGGNNVHITGNTFRAISQTANYWNDVVTNGTATITSATASFTAAMQGQHAVLQKAGQTNVDGAVLTYVNPTTMILDHVVPFTTTGASFYMAPPSAAVIDIEPNALTTGSENLDISNNIMDGKGGIGSFNGITVQKGYSGATRYVKVDNNIIVGGPQVTNYFVPADVDTTADTIYIVRHGLETGQSVSLQATTPPLPFTGLFNNFFAIVVDQDHIKLADTFPERDAGYRDQPHVGGKRRQCHRSIHAG